MGNLTSSEEWIGGGMDGGRGGRRRGGSGKWTWHTKMRKDYFKNNQKKENIDAKSNFL